MFGLLIWEFLLSIYLPQLTLDRLELDTPAIYVESDVLLYELRPNYQGRLSRDEFDTTITINSHGFRGKEIASHKDDRFRILAIGDSFTFGHGVENDEVYPYILEKTLSVRQARKVEVVNAGSPGYNPGSYYLFLRARAVSVPAQYADPFSKAQSENVTQAQKLLRAMYDMAGSRGIALAVVMMPALEQITMPAELVAMGADFDKPQRVFSAFLEAEGIPYLDLLAATRTAGPKLYFPEDEHWNRDGHAFAARKIAEFLKQKDLVPVRKEPLFN